MRPLTSQAEPAGSSPTPAEQFWGYVRSLKAQRPPLLEALRKDAATFAANRGERFQFKTRGEEWRNVLRIAWSSDDFLGLALYRARASLQARGVPILPRLLNKICAHLFGIRIGDHPVLKAGIYIPHGHIVIDGFMIVGEECVLSPWTTLGVLQGSFLGPRLGDGVFVGTGAKILGYIEVGSGARIGANAVVLHDVPPQATAAGVPARIVEAADSPATPRPIGQSPEQERPDDGASRS